MNFPRSLPSNSGCPFSQNPSYFQSLFHASRELCPAQISDPDMFITFHSPACSQEAQSPTDLGGLSPRSEDSLERTIKKLKLNETHTEESPEYKPFNQETQSILSDFQPWSNFQFDVSQGASTLEGEAGNVGLGSSLSGSISQCPMFPMFEKMRGVAEKEVEKKPAEEEEDDEIIFLDSKPGNGSQNSQPKITENKPSQCMRHLVLGQGGEKTKVHKGAKTVHEVTMLGEHEKMLWQSFVKVHSHIPDFPANDIEHLDYITMILRNKANHLFNIGKQQVKDLTKPVPEIKRSESVQTNNSRGSASQSSDAPEDPRMVFNKPYHKQLLEKCPIMHDYFQNENSHDASPALTQNPVIHTPATHPPTPQVINPHILPGSGANLPNPHMRMPVFPSPQPLMPCNTVISDKNHAIQLLNAWFGMGYNHFVRAQNPNNPGMSGCPMKHLLAGAGNPQPQPPGRERRGAFKAALTKMKSGSNRK